MSVNQFVGNTWGGAGVVAFERDKMLQGLPAQAVYFDLFSVDPNLGGMLPSDLDGPAPALVLPTISCRQTITDLAIHRINWRSGNLV